MKTKRKYSGEMHSGQFENDSKERVSRNVFMLKNDDTKNIANSFATKDIGIQTTDCTASIYCLHCLIGG